VSYSVGCEFVCYSVRCECVCYSLQLILFHCDLPDRWRTIHAACPKGKRSQPDTKLQLLARLWCFTGGQCTICRIL